MSTTLTRPNTQNLESRIRELGDWFHNIDLNGVQTAPNHFLGDYPRCKFERSHTRSLPT